MSEKRRKTGGRKAGTPNKLQVPLRLLITDFITRNWRYVMQDFETLQPKERLLFFEKLLKYTLPSLQAINVTSELEEKTKSLSDEELEELASKVLAASIR
jgi:hypothetical protein